MTIINRIEELSKIDIILKLQKARFDELIDDEEFHRYVLRVDHTPLSDLNYMKDNIKNDTFFMDFVQQESLVSNGWIIYAGSSWRTQDDEREDVNLYRFSESSKNFL